MITLQRENVQKIVTSKEQAAKLVLAGFRVVNTSDEETSERTSMFICPVCGKTYKTADGLEQHMASRHPAINEGGESFEPARADTDIVDEEKTPMFICPVCGKPYKTADGLEQHMASKHPAINEGGESFEPAGTNTDIVEDRVEA